MGTCEISSSGVCCAFECAHGRAWADRARSEDGYIGRELYEKKKNKRNIALSLARHAPVKSQND